MLHPPPQPDGMRFIQSNEILSVNDALDPGPNSSNKDNSNLDLLWFVTSDFGGVLFVEHIKSDS